MPFKRNPINAEKINSLARQLSVYPQIAWQNAASSLLERTLDDSANRRMILPEAFLTADEILRVSHRILQGLIINENAIQRNLEMYAPFAMTERILMLAGKRGADRQMIHELLRQQAISAWSEVQNGRSNPLIENLSRSSDVLQWVSAEEIRQLADLNFYTGFARQHALDLVSEIRKQIQ